MRTLFIFITGSIILLTGCISEWDKMLDTDYLDYEIQANTDMVKPDNLDIEIGTYRKKLSVLFDLDLPRDFQFPIDSSGRHKLCSTDFNIEFYDNGKPIKTSFELHEHSSNQTPEMHVLKIETSPRNLLKDPKYEIEIPLLALHEVKSGMHEIEMRIWQDYLYIPPFYSNTESIEFQEMDTTLIDFTVKFQVEIPEIQQIMICSDTIKLQDDEEWSPQNMDFSFRKGYPDIYWSIYSPATGDEDYKHLYFSSEVMDYSYQYTRQDTVRFFHFEEPENLIITVSDYDTFNKDDFIGNWFGSFNELMSNDEYKVLSFDHVSSFRIKAVNKGIYNK